MIEIHWLALLATGIGVWFASSAVTTVALLKLASWFDAHQRKLKNTNLREAERRNTNLGRRYPGDGGPPVN